MSKIEWTQQTWNPVRGCSMAKGSETGGCLNCYAARQAARGLPGMNSPTTGEPFAVMRAGLPRWTGKVELVEHMLDIPLRRRIPTTYFVNSMSDLFHESLPDDVIDRIFGMMAVCSQHTFQVLTKRAKRMLDWTQGEEFRAENMHGEAVRDAMIEGNAQSIYAKHYRGHAADNVRDWLAVHQPLSNVWLGVSVENRANLYRIDHLRATPAAVRFISFEPLLEDLNGISGYLRGIDWAIVGGESGPDARPCDVAWVRSIVEQCKVARVPIFVKQLGAVPISVQSGLIADVHFPGKPLVLDPYDDGPDGQRYRPHLKDRKGGDPSEWPSSLRVRQMPEGVHRI